MKKKCTHNQIAKRKVTHVPSGLPCRTAYAITDHSLEIGIRNRLKCDLRQLGKYSRQLLRHLYAYENFIVSQATDRLAPPVL